MSKGKSIVVNYNEKAFVFNVSSGETIDRMQTRLSEVYSIPIEYQQVYVASSQKFENKEKDLSTVSASVEVKVNFFSEFNPENFTFLPKIYDTVDYFILDLRPTLSSLLNRKVVLEYVKKTLSKCLGARAFCVGSSMNNVFLPDEMMEVTPFLCKGQEDKWVLRVNEGLCSAAFSSAESPAKDSNSTSVNETNSNEAGVSVNSVTFDCKSSCVLADINGMNVRISQNQLEALYNGALLEDINFICKKSSLFKKSLLLIKSWCSYDSKQFSPNGKTIYPDVLPSFVLDIMVVHIISRYGDAIDHPLHTLALFLQFYSSIDFGTVIITMTDILSISTFEPIVDDELKAIRQEKLSNEINMKYRELFNGYRLRYEATVKANRRAKEDTVPPLDVSNNNIESYTIEDAGERNKNSGISWGMSSENPSLTVDFKPSSQHNAAPSPLGALSQEGGKNFDLFPKSFMNVIGPFKTQSNIAAQLTASDVHELTSLLQCGLKRFEQTMQACRLAADCNSNGCVDMGDGVEIPVESYFIGECFGLSRDKIVVEKELHGRKELSDAEAIEELRMSKYYCEVESPEDVLRHAELIMGSKITADAVANLIVHIIEQMGPLPIGEIGKLLQEFTGNQNLSRILKSQFRGLKKLIEGYPSSLIVGGDHNFNPHVYLAKTKTPGASNDQENNSQQSPSPPALQVQHEQQVQQQQQLSKTRNKMMASPSINSTNQRILAPQREEPTTHGFQLSASSPAFIGTMPNRATDPWREHQSQGSRHGSLMNQSHNGDISREMNNTITREAHLSSSYYADDRHEATQTAFYSTDQHHRGGGGRRETYNFQQPHQVRNGRDLDDRSMFPPRDLNFRGPISSGDLEKLHYHSGIAHQHHRTPDRDDPNYSSRGDLSGPYSSRLDQEYASSTFHLNSYNTGDYNDGVSDRRGSGPTSGRYPREAQSGFGGGYQHSPESLMDRRVSEQHQVERYMDRNADRHLDREWYHDRMSDRQSSRYNVPERNSDPYYMTAHRGQGLNSDGEDFHEFGRSSSSRHVLNDRGGGHNSQNYLQDSNYSRMSGEDRAVAGGGIGIDTTGLRTKGGDGNRSVGVNNSSQNYPAGQSPVDSQMLPYFLRDT